MADGGGGAMYMSMAEFERILPDSLWAYRDGFGGVPTAFVYVEHTESDGRLAQTLFVSTAISPDDDSLKRLQAVSLEEMWTLASKGKLKRIDNPDVAIQLPVS
jgi:hypothetical protein